MVWFNWRHIFKQLNYFSIQHEASRRAGQADGQVQPGPLPQETKVYCPRVRGPGFETHSQVIVCDMWTADWTLRLQEFFSFNSFIQKETTKWQFLFNYIKYGYFVWNFWNWKGFLMVLGYFIFIFKSWDAFNIFSCPFLLFEYRAPRC